MEVPHEPAQCAVGRAPAAGRGARHAVLPQTAVQLYDGKVQSTDRPRVKPYRVCTCRRCQHAITYG